MLKLISKKGKKKFGNQEFEYYFIGALGKFGASYIPELDILGWNNEPDAMEDMMISVIKNRENLRERGAGINNYDFSKIQKSIEFFKDKQPEEASPAEAREHFFNLADAINLFEENEI